MPDDRYLEGDPDRPAVCLLDTSEFIANTAQECQLVADLIAAGRYEDARVHAMTRAQTAKSLLRTLEVEPLPEVDVDRTPDTALRSRWKFKGQP